MDFLAGALLKLYDDFVDDEPYIVNIYAVTILKYLQIAVVTLALSRDFYLNLLFTIFNFVCAFSSFKEYSKHHVVAYSVLCPLLLFFSWNKRSSFQFFDIPVILTLLGTAFLEPRMFPEETSKYKWFARAWAFYASLTTAFIFPVSPSVKSTLLLQSGYCIISSLAQMSKLYLSSIRGST